jgi:hypothetical protein
MLINLGGYFIAGILGAVFYAVIFKSKKHKEQPVLADMKNNQPAIQNTASRAALNTNTKIEFIKLGEQKSRLSEQVQRNLPSGRKSIGSRRENRMEIINLAKTMLKTGASFENIKKVLPVSDTELNLLQLKNN